MNHPKRILLYSHDTFGLGHIRRTQKIANTIASPDRSILIACASPKASAFASQPGIEYLNLPGFTKKVTGEYTPRSLNIPLNEFVQLRSELLLSAVKAFRPDFLLIDKEPLGVKKELVPALTYLREHRPQCHIACGFRDILDDQASVREEWTKRETKAALKHYFDSILIYGEREIFDFGKEYELPKALAERLIFTGYLRPQEKGHDSEEVEFDFPVMRPQVTFTLGGGGDGWEFLDTFLDGLENDPDPPSFNSVILTGPFADPKLIARAKRIADRMDHMRAAAFTTNALGVFERSQLVVCMGGYNTISEVLSLGKRTLILPRVEPRREQLLRAQVFKARGYCDFIPPDTLTSLGLIQSIKQQLLKPAPPFFPTTGLDGVKRFVDEVLK